MASGRKQPKAQWMICKKYLWLQSIIVDFGNKSNSHFIAPKFAAETNLGFAVTYLSYQYSYWSLILLTSFL